MEFIKLAVRLPANQPPAHPGEMLLEEFLKPLGMTQTELARLIGVSYVRINELVNGRRGVTPDTALRLGRLLRTGPAWWLKDQLRWDMWHALHSPEIAEIERIGPLDAGELPLPIDGGKTHRATPPLAMDNVQLAVRLPAGRKPFHAGTVLLEEFLEPRGVSQAELARLLGVSYVRVNELVNGKRGITPDTALRLGRLFRTGPEYWLNHQLRWDMWHALLSPAMAEIEKIQPLPRDPAIYGDMYEPEAVAAD